MYKPEKMIWTESDFEKMGWHDCPIYGILFNDQVLFDIDYIFSWVLDGANSNYKFWISPATLKFENPRDLQINVKLNFVNGLEIYKIVQKKMNEKEYEYQIETQEGEIRLVATGFKQHIRKEPFLKNIQYLTSKERSGYSF